jgi:dihydroxyacetone kinase-like protein
MAEADGIEVRTVVINDDVAVKDSLYTVGRRGVAGNFFVIKAVGAASERGKSLEELEALGNRVVSVTRTMGMALTGCTPPAKGTPIFTLAEDEMEVGIGIHGEPGRKRVKMEKANQIVDELFEAVSTDLPYQSGDEVALMINGLGGTPISELYLLYAHAHELVEKCGMKVKRNYVGEYCTSLEMAGFSLTLVKLDPELEELLAAPAETAMRIY